MTETITEIRFDDELRDESLDRTETGRACYWSFRTNARACIILCR